MPKIKYRNINISTRSLDLIAKCNDIIEEYTGQGFVLTLRQVYYKLVARDLFPDDRRWTWTGVRWVRDENGTKNAEPNYKWLGGLINDARLAGLIDWDAIEDRTRNLASRSHWTSPVEMLESCAEQFHVDLWSDQKYHPEVWIEKDALVGLIEGVCKELDVPYLSCRGYTSQSEMWAGAMRLKQNALAGKIPIIFHLGDHDPSGKDMTRDISERLEMFMGGVQLDRLALNMNQIEKFEPPPNPAKTTDSRFTAYMAEFGDESWELDALEPVVINDLIRKAVNKLINKKKWKARLALRQYGRNKLKDVAKQLEDQEG